MLLPGWLQGCVEFLWNFTKIIALLCPRSLQYHNRYKMGLFSSDFSVSHIFVEDDVMLEQHWRIVMSFSFHYVFLISVFYCFCTGIHLFNDVRNKPFWMNCFQGKMACQ